MIQRIKCLFGRHRWWYVSAPFGGYSESRFCPWCGREESLV